MNKKSIFLLSIVVGSLSIFNYLGVNIVKQFSTDPASSTNSSVNTELSDEYPIVLDAKVVNKWTDTSPKVDNLGEVTVQITPINLHKFEELLSFDVLLNTHSVDLTMDFVSLFFLTSSNGLNLTPSNWQGEVGGHHLAGEIDFLLSEKDIQILRETKEIVLTLIDVDVSERVFLWKK